MQIPHVAGRSPGYLAYHLVLHKINVVGRNLDSGASARHHQGGAGPGHCHLVCKMFDKECSTESLPGMTDVGTWEDVTVLERCGENQSFRGTGEWHCVSLSLWKGLCKHMLTLRLLGGETPSSCQQHPSCIWGCLSRKEGLQEPF